MILHNPLQIKYKIVRKLPNASSPKKKRYVAFNCPHCNLYVEKTYYKNMNLTCNSCSQGTKITTEDFIKRAELKFPNMFYYSKTKYTGSLSKLIVTCKKHGDIEVRPSDFLSGVYGCSACSHAALNDANTKNIEHYTEYLPENITLLEYNKVGHDLPVVVECNKHGVFRTTFGALRRNKYVCKKCSYVKHQMLSIRKTMCNEDLCVLYYVFIPTINMYKVGITTRKLSERLSGITFKVIKTWEFTIRVGAELEHIIMVDLSKFRILDRDRLIPFGSTELFDVDVLDKIESIINDYRAS